MLSPVITVSQWWLHHLPSPPSHWFHHPQQTWSGWLTWWLRLTSLEDLSPWSSCPLGLRSCFALVCPSQLGKEYHQRPKGVTCVTDTFLLPLLWLSSTTFPACCQNLGSLHQCRTEIETVVEKESVALLLCQARGSTVGLCLKNYAPSPQWGVASFTQSSRTLCDPVDCSTPGLPVHHHLPEPTQTRVHWLGDVIQPSHPLSSPSPPAFNLSQDQGLFWWVGSLHQMAKVLQLQHQSFQWVLRIGFL